MAPFHSWKPIMAEGSAGPEEAMPVFGSILMSELLRASMRWSLMQHQEAEVAVVGLLRTSPH